MSKQRHEWELKATDNTKGATRSATAGLQRLNQGLTGIVKSYGAVGVAGVAAIGILKRQAEAVYKFIDAQAKLGDEMDKFSQRSGEQVEVLSEWRFAVERGGGAVGDLENFMKRLSRAMGDAQAGTKIAVDAFSQLGITVDQMSNRDGSLKSFSQMMPLIADGLSKISNQAQRMDLVQELGGRGGSMLLPFLQDGAEGIRRMSVEMERYGGAMSGTFATKGAEFVDAQTNLATAAQRLKEAVSEPFLGPFTAAVNDLAATIGALSSMQKTGGAGWKAMGLVPGATGGVGNFMAARGANAQDKPGESYLDYFGLRPVDLSMPASSVASPARSHDPSGDFRGSWHDQDDRMAMAWEAASPGDESTASLEGLGLVMEDLDASAGGLTRGMQMLSDSQAAATIEAERLANMSGLARTAIEGISGSFNQALYLTLTDTRKFGRDFVDIMRRVFADALATAGGNVIGGVLGGVFKGATGKSLASPGSKSMPGAGALVQQGRMASAASAAYGKAYA